LSIRRQCELRGLSRGSFYYEPVGEPKENLRIMRRIDALDVAHPFLGSRRLVDREGVAVNRPVPKKQSSTGGWTKVKSGSENGGHVPDIRSAELTTTGEPSKVERMSNARWRISGLPSSPPVDLAPVIRIEFTAPPYLLPFFGAAWLDGEYRIQNGRDLCGA